MRGIAQPLATPGQHEGGAAMDHRNRNTALVLIAAGLYILLGHYISFFTIAALFFIIFGIYRIRSSPDKTGYVLLGLGAVLFFSNHFMLVVSIILISLGLFYMKSKEAHKEKIHFQKHNLVESFKRGQEPWEPKNMSLWNIAGEIYMDFSLAMPEQKETTIVLQGVFGDVDVIVPEFLGVSVNATVFVGQIHALNERETGLVNKVVWESPNYETSDQKVKLFISYFVGDIDIKVV
jgi:lia operon protein LiaF